jgi:hypothetical protein
MAPTLSAWLRETAELFLRYVAVGLASIPLAVGYAFAKQAGWGERGLLLSLAVSGLITAAIVWKQVARWQFDVQQTKARAPELNVKGLADLLKGMESQRKAGVMLLTYPFEQTVGEKVFQVFYSGKEQTGTGLGLWMASSGIWKNLGPTVHQRLVGSVVDTRDQWSTDMVFRFTARRTPQKDKVAIVQFIMGSRYDRLERILTLQRETTLLQQAKSQRQHADESFGDEGATSLSLLAKMQMASTPQLSVQIH